MANGHGGARPGAGRKKGRAGILGERMKETIAEEITRELPKLIGPLMRRVKEEGDVQAFKELFDRGFGRSTQPVELEVEKKKLIVDDSPKVGVPSPVAMQHTAVIDDEDKK